METLWQNWRFGLRSLRRSPGFTITVVCTLALGIGAATSVFSVAYGILLKPLPMRDPQRVLALWAFNPLLQPDHVPLNFPEYRALARETSAFETMAAYDYHGTWPQTVRFGDTATTLSVATVTGNFFDVLGVHPRAGRLLRPDDDLRGAGIVAVISDRLWFRAFGNDPAVVGKTFTMYGREIPIVGVAPLGMDFPRGADLWLPITAYGADPDTANFYFDVIGRLHRGASVGQVRSELGAFLVRPSEPHRDNERSLASILQPVARPVSDVILGDVRPALRVVVAAVALLLLVTCINVANLMLVRAIARRREFSVRAALGAGGGRIVGQMLVENAAMVMAGGALGVLSGWIAVRTFVAIAPATIPRIDEVTVNGPVLAGALALSIGLMVVFALLPAVFTDRLSLIDSLRERRTEEGGATMQRARALLVGSQVAIALSVLVAAGVVLRSFEALVHLNLGFTTDHLVVARLGTTPAIKDESGYNQALDEVLARLRSEPGVASATSLFVPPFKLTGLDVAYMLPESPKWQERPMLDELTADSAYFHTLGIPLRRGRAFTADDRAGSAQVIIVDEALAAQFWPQQDPIGKRLAIDDNGMRTVVGVVGETRYRDWLTPRASVYVPYRQTAPDYPLFALYLAVRTKGDPGKLISSLRHTVQSANPDLTVSQITTLAQSAEVTRAQPRLNALLLGGFGISILLLTGLGLYSVAATYVRYREFELSVRMALGARPDQVLSLVLRQGMTIVVAGAAVGVVAGVAGAGLLRSVSFGVQPRDPVAFGAALLLIGTVAILALWLPARRAAKANPADALRAG
jgi:putative ABC transport system permease protein